MMLSHKQFNNGSKYRGEWVEGELLGLTLSVQRWKDKKTYDNKTGEHTGGQRPMLYTSMLNCFGYHGVQVFKRQE